MLSTWKPFGLAQRVHFSGLSRTEAGIYPAELKMENGYDLSPTLSKWRGLLLGEDLTPSL